MLKLKASLCNIFYDEYRFYTKGMYIRDKVAQVVHIAHSTYEPWRKKTGLRGFRPGLTQTSLCNHRRWLEA